MCAPDDSRVLEKAVCYNEKSAVLRGRGWKRRNPERIVRAFSLLPGDTSRPIEISLVLMSHSRVRK